MFFTYVNNAINFFLYCLGGKTYKEEFLKMIGCFKAADHSAQDIALAELEGGNIPQYNNPTNPPVKPNTANSQDLDHQANKTNARARQIL